MSARTGHHYTRKDVSFQSDGTRCAAWLYRPAGRAPRPAIVMGHGLGAVKELRLDAYAERFAAAGYTVLVFDHRHLGASDGQPRQLIDIRRQLDDWHAALDYVRSLPEVDTSRIAIWGSSLGGGHVMQVAAEDPDLAAVVAQCPFTDGLASTLARIRAALPSGAVLLAAAVVDQLGALAGRRPVLTPMAGPGWMPAFLAFSGSMPGAIALAPTGTTLSRRTNTLLKLTPALRTKVLEHVGGVSRTSQPDDLLWGVLRDPDGNSVLVNGISARLALRLPTYRPGRALRRTTTPVLVCVCDNDEEAPAAATTRHVRDLPHVEVQHYPLGHFDIYLGDAFEQAVADQLAFLDRQLSHAAQPIGSAEALESPAAVR